MTDLNKIPLSKLKKKIDTEFSLYIRRRDNFICCTCGRQGSEKDGIMQCGHLFSRVALSTRWEPYNAACQCKGCNMRHEYDWEPMRQWFIKKYGEHIYEILYQEYKKPRKFTRNELIGGYEYYKSENKKYESRVLV